jgi:hypothetical protein
LLLRRQGSHDRLASKLRAEAAELRNANAELHTKLVSAIAKTIQLKVEVRPVRACVRVRVSACVYMRACLARAC